MIKKIIFFALLFSFFRNYSQEVLGGIDLSLKKESKTVTFFNDFTNETILLNCEKEKVLAVVLDEKLNQKKEFDFNKPEKKYKEILSSLINKNGLLLFWSTTDCSEIQLQQLDNNNLVTNKNEKIKIREETFLKNFTLDNKFYLVNFTNNINVLKFYIFDSEGNLTEKFIDLKNTNFTDLNKMQVDFQSLVKEQISEFDKSYEIP